METFWSKVPQFQDIPEDNIIVLDPYLNAAEAATTIFGNFTSCDVSDKAQESEVLSIIRYRGTSKVAGQLLPTPVDKVNEH